MAQAKLKRKFFKNEAKRIIFSEWLNAVIATLVVVLVIAGLSAIQSAYLYLLSKQLSQNATIAVSVFFNVASALVFLPVLFGYIIWCVQKYEGDAAPVSNVFEVFSTPENLGRAYAVTLAFLMRAVVLFAIPVLLNYFLKLNTIRIEKHLSEIYPILPELFTVVSKLFILFFYSIAFSMTAKLFMFVYIAIKNPDMSLRMCSSKAAKLMRGHKVESVVLNFSFFGWILLSLFTAGVLFVIFVIPYMLLSIISFCSYLYAKNDNNLNNLEHVSLTKTVIKE